MWVKVSEGNMGDEDDGEDNAEISGESSRGTSGKSSRESNRETSGNHCSLLYSKGEISLTRNWITIDKRN